jgi:hypothetical protein
VQRSPFPWKLMACRGGLAEPSDDGAAEAL